MGEYLIFTLAASIGAMGELAGHERRGSLLWPGRSALIGLLGAALGIRRGGDFSALDQLSILTAVYEDGTPLRDFHSVQTVPTAQAKAPNSRPEALDKAGRNANTILTQRDYRSGLLYGIVVWNGALAPVRDALNAPAFTLYLGRRACPLSAPPAARLVIAETPAAALAHLTIPKWYLSAHEETGKKPRYLIGQATEENAHLEEIHDLPIDRTRRHFGARRVSVLPVSSDKEGL